MSISQQKHRFFTSPVFAMGQSFPGESGLRLNETATRVRAVVLNLVSTSTILILLFAPELDPVIYVGPFVIWEMLSAAIFGLTPLAPVGMLASALTMKMKPKWKPTRPKRFAWLLGTAMGVCCLSFRLLGLSNTWIISVLAVCFLLTFLEAALGFCVGCWMHGKIWGCEECKVSYTD